MRPAASTHQLDSYPSRNNSMGTLHRKAPVSDSEASLFPTLREWMEKTPVKFSKAGHQASFDANFSFAELRDAIRDLERLLIPLRWGLARRCSGVCQGLQSTGCAAARSPAVSR